MTALRATLRSARALAEAGLIDRADETAIARVGARYAVAIPPAMADLVEGDPALDPIARQFVPDARELVTYPEETADPIGDGVRSPVPGIVHRYPDRVLLKVIGVCPVYCRFCFRREMVGPSAGHNPTDIELAAALDYIRETPEIWEVIGTGGDPFMLSARRVTDLGMRLGAIPHVRILRWHTRVPIVAPDLVTEDFVGALGAFPRTTYIGVHVNHPRELHDAALDALVRLADAGLALVSQTVLLKGVNDDAGTLETLMRRLVEHRVVPHYLHHGDMAPGTAHFRVPIARGQSIARELRRRVSGLARPEYVLDIPGGYGKVDLLSADVAQTGDGQWRITDASGRTHSYPDICAA